MSILSLDSLPAGSAEVVKSVVPKECPHNKGKMPSIAGAMQAEAAWAHHCIIILVPDEHTQRMMVYLAEEIGANSKSSRKGLVTKYPGTGSGRYTISPSSVIRPYLVTDGEAAHKDDANGKQKCGGMFFREDISQIVLGELRQHLSIHPNVLRRAMPESSQNFLPLPILGIVSEYLTPPHLEDSSVVKALEEPSVVEPAISAAVVEHSSSYNRKDNGRMAFVATLVVIVALVWLLRD